MFSGEYINTIDAKGRVVVPARFREELGDNFVLTRGVDKCVFVYTKERFESMMEKFSGMPTISEQNRRMARFLVASSMPGEYDTQGRVLVPPHLREYAGLQKEIRTIGVVDRIEIWDKDAYAAYQAENFDGEAFAQAVESFGF